MTNETWVKPNPGIPKTLGILNIVFAAGLLLCGGCYGFYLAILPAMAPIMKAQQKEMTTKLQAQADAEIAELKKEKEAAETEEAKEQIEARITQTQKKSQVQINVQAEFDFEKMGLNDPYIMGSMWADIVTGLILNVLLLISGIGLTQLKGWGRGLAQAVAAIKIVRLGAVSLALIFLVIPRVTAHLIQMIAEAQKMQAGGPPPQAAAQTIGTVYTIGAVIYFVLGIIYPVMVLILLNRDSVRAAFRKPEQLDAGGLS